ncbi:hypothetical protein ACI2KR_27375 [Pseudomonas luteola]
MKSTLAALFLSALPLMGYAAEIPFDNRIFGKYEHNDVYVLTCSITNGGCIPQDIHLNALRESSFEGQGLIRMIEMYRPGDHVNRILDIIPGEDRTLTIFYTLKE